MKHIDSFRSGLLAERRGVNIQEEGFPEILHGQMKRQLTNVSACAAQAAWCPRSCSNISHQFKHARVSQQPGVRPTVCSDAAFAASAAWRQKHSLERHNTSNYLCRLHVVLGRAGPGQETHFKLCSFITALCTKCNFHVLFSRLLGILLSTTSSLLNEAGNLHNHQTTPSDLLYMFWLSSGWMGSAAP